MDSKSNSKTAKIDQPKPAFKLHIDSKLIKSNSEVLPDELRSLNVCAYDENDFEKGILRQVDQQIAEYEDDSSQSNDAKTSKRKSSNNTDHLKKKAKLSSLIDDDSTQSEPNSIENLIKKGEMTPFGTVIDTVINNKVVSKSTDFDSFLFGLDKKARKPKPKVHQEIKATNSKAVTYVSSTDNTAFDQFLNDFDTKPKMNDKKVKKTEENIVKPSTSQTANKVAKKSSDATNVSEFEKCLFNIDSMTPKKKSTKPVEKQLEKNKKTIDPLSFMQMIEQDDKTEDLSQETSLDLNDSNPSSEQFDINSILDSASNDKEDYDDISDKPYEPSDVEYETEEEKDNDYDLTKMKRKKKFNKNCLDDGDDILYNKRLKRLEKYERELAKEQESDNEELEDIENGLSDEIEPIIDDEDAELELNENSGKDFVLNNNQHVELDASGFKVPENIWNRLYKFQKTALNWFWELHTKRCGGILGDEMGLGKTITTIAYLASLKYSKVRSIGFSYIGLGPVLLIAPLTLIGQWVESFHKWWPYIRVSVLHDIGTYRETSKKKLIDKTFASNGVLITTYSTLLNHDRDLISKNWHYIVLDEGHKIRNPDAKITIVTKCFRTPHRIILSGSPIQNNLKELWSLFDFVFPGKLGTMQAFMENFSVPIVQGGFSNASDVQVQTAYKCACVLRDTIAPYLLRRVKNDVKMTINLPTKNEQILFCRLSKEQKTEYVKYINSRECQYIINSKHGILKALIQLRKICNHSDIVTDQYYKNPSWSNISDFDLVQAGQHGYLKRSGKMVVVDALLKMWKKQEGRVLLFSQSRVMLDILEKYIKFNNYSFLRMDGTTNGKSRPGLVKQFNENPSIFIFLLTTKVGGLGLNLIGANKIIIFDPDWNPVNDLQARERAWRIGQTRNVTIYRLLTSGTIEEKIYHRQIFKQFLSNKILKDPRQKRFFKTNDLHELFTFASIDDESLETNALFAGTGSEMKSKKLDGNYVPNLDKIKKNKHKEDDSNKKVDKKSDDYVLGKLFKTKKGGQSFIHTAHDHEKIIENPDPDFTLVELEAERVANEAIKALKESRKYCRSAETGIPNLVGIKFGSKVKLSIEKEKSDTNTSKSLLDRIKLRNQAIHIDSKATPPLDKNKTKNDKTLKINSTNPIERSIEMSKMIKEYFTSTTGTINRATTQEIVDYFKDQVLKEDGAKFKAILKKLCTLNQSTGVWSLNDSYFNL